MRPIRGRILGPLVCLSVLAAVFAVPAALGDDEAPPEVVASAPAVEATLDETPPAWFVQLASPPAARGGSREKLKQEKAAFRAAAKDAGLEYSERFAFDELWNGLSIAIDASQVGALTQLPGVDAVYPVLTVSLEPLATVDPDLATAIAQTGADLAQASGWTGAGVRVGVIDSGVDYHHPDLGGCFGPGCRVERGYDLVGDDFDANPNSATYDPIPSPDRDPDDCGRPSHSIGGHGTHVAGIVGAKPAGPGGARGVAPDVTLGAYRVFGCNGSSTEDVVIAALERALADGMDVVNVSGGTAFVSWPQSPSAAAAGALVDAGTVVVASAGNNGAFGLYSVGSPGAGDKVIAVASFENSHISALTFVVNPSGRSVPYLPLAAAPDPPSAGTTPEIVHVGRGCPANSIPTTNPGVHPADPYLGDPAGKVALIDRRDCSFNAKYQRAADAGAAGILVANNVSGLFSGSGIVSRGIFAVGISKQDGDHVKGLAAGRTLTWTSDRASVPNPSGGRISAFSSYGLDAELALKPDLGAPGGLIRSTYPLEYGGYLIASGTSASSPHAAGGAALLLQAKPLTPAAAVQTILQNSADPAKFGTSATLLEVVHRQGAGMLDVDDSILSATTVEPGKISLGEGLGGTVPLTISNGGAAAVTYTLSHERAMTTGPRTFAVQLFGPTGLVSFPAGTSVTVPAGGTATVPVTIGVNPLLPDKSVYGGFVKLTQAGGGQAYRVPYAGFKGDYQSIQALVPTACGFPWLAKRTAGSTFTCAAGAVVAGYTRQAEGATYTMADGDVPYFLVHLDHPARRMEMKVVRADTLEPVGDEGGLVFADDYLPRNGTATSFFALSWDGKRLFTDGGRGKLHRRAVPDGEYKVIISVLKALGDPANPAHTETWTSPTITIARP